MENENKDRFMRIGEVLRRVSLSRSSLYHKMKIGEFPQSIKLGMTEVAWLESEVEKWIKEKVENRNQKEKTNGK